MSETFPERRGFADLLGSGRQGTRRRTSSDRPHRTDERKRKLFWHLKCCWLILDCFRHENPLCLGRKARNDVNDYENEHVEDEQEPVQARGVEPPAGDPLRPEPRSRVRLTLSHVASSVGFGLPNAVLT